MSYIEPTKYLATLTKLKARRAQLISKAESEALIEPSPLRRAPAPSRRSQSESPARP